MAETDWICSSVFQDGADQVTPQRLTAAWIAVIRQLQDSGQDLPWRTADPQTEEGKP